MVGQFDSTVAIARVSQRGQNVGLEPSSAAAVCRNRILAGRRTPLEGPWVADTQHCWRSSLPLIVGSSPLLPTALGVC